MHLLLARGGSVAGDGEAIDLGQSPGAICVLSAADTELASLAAAQAGRGSDAPTLRLVNLMRLAHPMSVDAWIERTGRHADLIVARVLGGRGYFAYGLDALRDAARTHGVRFVALPGDGNPDPDLARFSTVDGADAERLWRLLVEGGSVNAATFLDHAAHMLGRGEPAGSVKPLPAAGLWWKGRMARREEIVADWVPGAPCVAVCFYRALVQGGQTAPVAALADALRREGLNPLPVFVASLKNEESQHTVRDAFAWSTPRVVLNTTGFAASLAGVAHAGTALDEGGAVVLQAVLAGQQREAWARASQGLSARDLAMNVALPEVDGRVLTRAFAFKDLGTWDERTECAIVASRPDPDRTAFVAELARRWARLPTSPAERRVAIVLANYPTQDGRIGNGVGLDTPAGTLELMRAMAREGYDLAPLPADGGALIERLLEARRTRDEVLPAKEYEAFLAKLPASVREAVEAQWGSWRDDPASTDDGIVIPALRLGRTVVGVQPARGYGIDPKETYHSPDLVPPHAYLAFYAWVRREADVVLHMGKHGNLEWLPGKALALSAECFPEALLGPMPHVYPFIVNDPGEGSQAKRRAQAVIVDHLTPPLTRAESHGPMRQLEALVDEYFEAAGTDPRRVTLLAGEIVELARSSGIAADIGLADDTVDEAALERIDAWLCDLKELQIRDGLHVFGRSPTGRLRTDLLCALARVPRGEDRGSAGLTRALADDLGLGLDPLDCAMGEPWAGPRPRRLHDVSSDPWRTTGDTVERLELLAARLVGALHADGGDPDAPEGLTATTAVLAAIRDGLAPAVDACGEREIAATLAALSGRFVAPGPSGAPTRGRPDVLPTGRNFYSVDTRAVPTRAAWTLGARSAELVVVRHLQDHGEWPTSVGLSCWGTANMRTGGDDLAQALALIGARPTWDGASRRVTGFEVVPLAELGRPRVDVTLRISGFFRDAFPEQIALFDRAARAVGALDEPDDQNPVAARMRREREALIDAGADPDTAARRAGYRVFGSKPGAYGAGLQALIDERAWEARDDLAEAYTVWGSYAYGARAEGVSEREGFETRLATVEAVLHNQDNREHDLLDSDDYYQFEGGMTAAVERLRGERPAVYHNDHSRPERPVVRRLEEEIARVVRARVTNPKWIAGVMRHGYKGVFEVAATVDYLFAFAATTGAVRDHHFDAVHAAFIEDERVRDWMRDNNPHALREMSARLREAVDRELWRPRSNSARALLMEDA